MTSFDFSNMGELNEPSPSRKEDDYVPEQRDDAFRRKVSMQQFLNHNGPIFKAFAFKGIAISEVADGDALVGPTEAAASLGRLVASEILKSKPEQLTAKDLSFFRTEAANWVAEKWLKNEPYDIEQAAQSIAKVVLRAGKEWDHDFFRDDRISNDASVMMSAAGVTARLMEQVKNYDFRQGRNEVLKKILDAVIQTAVSMSSDMLPKNASKNDQINLIQTVTRNLSSIMEGIYRRKAKEVVDFLLNIDKDKRQAWLNSNRPVDEIVSEFNDWSHCFVGFAIATSQQIMRPQADEPRQNKTYRS